MSFLSWLLPQHRELERIVEEQELELVAERDQVRQWRSRCEKLEEEISAMVYAEADTAENPEPEKPTPPKRRTMRDIQRAKVAQTRAANAELLKKKQAKAQE